MKTGIVGTMDEKRKNFSLIELLIVVAIIAILAGLMLPALQRAREVARAADCRSREKQIGTAFLSYANDFNSYLPLCRSGDSSSPITGDPAGITWMVKLGSYLNTHPNEEHPNDANTEGDSSKYMMRNSFFWCRSPVVPTSNAVNPYPYGGNHMDRYRYGMNAELNGRSFGLASSADSNNIWGYKSLKLVQTPSAALLVGEIYKNWAGFSVANWHAADGNGNVPHALKSNMLFCDGHVASYSQNQILTRWGTKNYVLNNAQSNSFWIGRPSR